MLIIIHLKILFSKTATCEIILDPQLIATHQYPNHHPIGSSNKSFAYLTILLVDIYCIIQWRIQTQIL